MSRQNVEVLRRANERISKMGEIAPECYDPEVVYTTQPEAPVQSTYHAIDGHRRSLESLKEAWESIYIEEREFIEADGVIVVVFLFQLRGRGSGVELEVEQGWTCQMRNGLIWKLVQYGSKREALKAVGLPA
jgi:ketosteroid isomerase-like protein